MTNCQVHDQIQWSSFISVSEVASEFSILAHIQDLFDFSAEYT